MNIARSRNLDDIRTLVKLFKLEERRSSPKLYDVMGLLEDLQTLVVEQLNGHFYEIKEDAEMKSAAGFINTQTGVITLRNSIFEDADDGGAEGRFTVAHEIGHRLMHCGDNILYRALPDEVVDASQCPEEQADSFACELLLDIKFIKRNIRRLSPTVIAEFFGLPENKVLKHLERMMVEGEIPRLEFSGQLELSLQA